MNSVTAISLLMDYKKCEYRQNGYYILDPLKNYEFLRKTYGETLINYIIDIISTTDRDPIEIVRKIYRDMDTILSESDDDHFETHHFCSIVMREAGDILRYLKSSL